MSAARTVHQLRFSQVNSAVRSTATLELVPLATGCGCACGCRRHVLSELPGPGSIGSRTLEETDDVSRIPRSSLLYIALVAMLGMVFWFTWQSMENGSKGDAWSYSQLLTKADQGQVTKVDIKGSGATATDKGGSRHEVQLPDTGTDFLQQQLYMDNVDL